MCKNEVLWSQRAYGKKSTFSHFGVFIYEFIGARFTFIAFVAMFNFAAIGLDYFDIILTSGIALILFYLISDAFNVFWTGINLEYQITNEGLVYKWGVLRNHSLLVPFKDILKVTAIGRNGDIRKTLIFENSGNIKNKDFGFSKELFFNELSFENVLNIESAIKILEIEGNFEIPIMEKDLSASFDKKLTSSYMYHKFLQLLSLIFLYVGTHIGLNLLDSNFLSALYVKDVVVAQEKVPYGTKYYYNHLETEKGYTFVLKGNYFYDHMNVELELILSPIYKNVIGISDNKLGMQESLKYGYTGGVQIIFKIAALISSLLSGAYIFYKRSFIPFEDLSIFLLFPIFILSVAFFLFH